MELATQPLRHVIIGVGAWVYRIHQPALRLDTVQVAGVSDISVERGQPRAAELGCPFYTDHRLMLAEVKPDVAVIMTPHPTHADIALDCFAAGAHVLVEKPMAHSISDADRMIAAAERAGRILGVCFQRRFRPAVERAKALIDAGLLGPLVRTLCLEPVLRSRKYYQAEPWRGAWAGEGGAILVNQGPHALDTLCYLAGLAAQVWGWTRTRYHAIECEDTAQAMLEYRNGAPGLIAMSTAETSVKPRIEIVGERGALELIGADVLNVYRFGSSIVDYIRESSEIFDRMPRQVEALSLPDETGNHVSVYRDFHAAIREGRNPRTNGRDGLMAVEVMNAITLSSHTGGPVALPVDRAAYDALLAKLQRKGEQNAA
jgi:predicted dehydrogenase